MFGFLAIYNAAELADLITTVKVEVIGGKGQKPNLISTKLSQTAVLVRFRFTIWLNSVAMSYRAAAQPTSTRPYRRCAAFLAMSSPLTLILVWFAL